MASWLSFSFYCNAQDLLTSPNIITNQWSNTVPGVSGGNRGGNVAGFDPTTNTIMFGYTQQTVGQRIALEGTGIKLHGYNYSFEYNNSGFSRGYLAGSIILLDKDNKSLDTNAFSLNATEGWKQVNATRNFSNQYSLDYARTLSVNFTGKDDRYWAGYYGPQVRNVNVSLRYTQDLCATNPLSSPSCEGYEKAYFDLQCNASPFYSVACPGYEQANFQRLCTNNPLFNPTCPGYAAAKFTQQCTENSLFSKECPGYQQAFFNQQCSLNTLYNPSCPGYAKALFDKTCNENPLSSDACPLYQAAYLDQQCKANPLFSSACPMYQQAFFNQQCTANPLYNSGCLGYAEAFRKKQITDACNANPQSNPTCKGYEVVKHTVQSIQHSVAINEDPIKALIEPKLVEDPIVNQVLQVTPTHTLNHQAAPPMQTPQQNTRPQQGQRTEQKTDKSQSQRTSTGSRQAASSAARKSQQEQQQDDVVASMGNVPGFSSYLQSNIPDAPFYISEDIYRRANIPDNARALRQLNQRSDRIHKEMVDEQYRR